ncbi:thiamine pyrophosphate-binding protein [Ottowia sp.]|uniref:thiamine pyrophosphate-binding protein n=1 Tax=Ottowia sp. TaxID=1898956 RepID=UPI0025DC9754|nr:thiamine pyrophosphate-binding protein [Ottowia sp.]
MTQASPSPIAGHLLIECLIEQGVERAYGVPGESYLAALDGFYAHRDRIRFVTCRQEGGAAFMAEAEGKLTGRPGVLFVTRGPGAANATVGIHTAFQDSTPMVVFIGDVASDMRDREAFQEVDFRVFLGPSTQGFAKRVERIDDARRIPEYVARAFASAMNGRPGPVVLVLPEDMLTEPVDARPLPRVAPVQYQTEPQRLLDLREQLLKAKQPLVIAGGPGWTPAAAQALQRFAERWRLPVANAFRFQDTFDNHHALYAGDVGIAINPRLAERVRAADLLLVVGPRLGEMTTGGYTLVEAPLPRQKLVHIHPDPQELGRVYQAELALCATMPAAAAMLDALPAPASVPWAAWSEAAHADYQANLVPQALPGPIDMPAIVATLQRLLPADTVVTNGAGNFASWVHRFWRYHGIAKGHKTQLAPTSGAMGYGVPAGIGASIATGRAVFTIAGDGDFLMNGQELATAVQHGGKSIIVLLNNGSYGTIRMHQEREFPAHVSGSDLHNPDFVALARAYGWAGERVTRTEQFEPALQAALHSEQGSLIEVMLSEDIITTRATLGTIRQQALARQKA